MRRFLLSAIPIGAITAIVIFSLSFTGYLREPGPDSMVGFQPQFILVFVAFDAILIGIPAWVHRAYVKDYGTIKHPWVFALWGGVTGALMGEIALGASVLLILPYTVLMFIYGSLYKRFRWWQVALTAYLGGVVVENVINRSPIQIPTLMWIGLFVSPYFVTKIIENRDRIPLKDILHGLRYTLLASLILGLGAAYASRQNISPPLIVLGLALPFFVTMAVGTHRGSRIALMLLGSAGKVSVKSSLVSLRYTLPASAMLGAGAVYASRGNISPPLIAMGVALPFLVTAIVRVAKRS